MVDQASIDHPVNFLARGRLRRVVGIACLAVVFGACASAPGLRVGDGRVQVVTTTGLLADMVRNVGGDRVNVVSMVPANADPHAYEPSLRDVRDVAYADVAFSNYLLLEQQSIIKSLDANLPATSPNISLAEEAVKYAAEIIPLVEDVSLDTIWLGLRVGGGGASFGADRSSEVRWSVVDVDGPGFVAGYLTGAFGVPEAAFDSSDGFDRSDGFRRDTVLLPTNAHSHMSWAFAEAGVYRLTMRAQLVVNRTERPIDLGEGTYTFAVGVNPRRVAGMTNATVLGAGHADLRVNLDAAPRSNAVFDIVHDQEGRGHAQDVHAAADTVIEVPSSALANVPAGPGFRFLGRPGAQVYQLPQAVLGRHIHGEIDPHLWQDIRNGIAYAKLMRDTLIDIDPAGAVEYRRNADRYIEQLGALDAEIRATIAEIPRADRHLITTHDAFRYLAEAYDLDISGFVTPNPAVEPSLADRRALTETIRNLDVGAVFLEPNLLARSSMLTQVAADEGVEVCRIYGDTFDDEVTSYVEMMRFNSRSLRRCLTR